MEKTEVKKIFLFEHDINIAHLISNYLEKMGLVVAYWNWNQPDDTELVLALVNFENVKNFDLFEVVKLAPIKKKAQVLYHVPIGEESNFEQRGFAVLGRSFGYWEFKKAVEEVLEKAGA